MRLKSTRRYTSDPFRPHYFYGLFYCRLRLNINKLIPIRTGKMVAVKRPERSPICSISRVVLLVQKNKVRPLTWTKSDILPASQGPKEQPISPQIARIPNIKVPPLGKAAEDKLKVPGHNNATEKPQKLQAKIETIGLGLNMVNKYVVRQRMLLPNRHAFIGRRSPKYP